MGMPREEEEARDLLKADGACVVRTTGKHEIWKLGNGITYPLPAPGRKSAPRLWKNLLSQLRNALAGREHRQGKVCAADGRPIHLAVETMNDEDLGESLDEEEWRMDANMIQGLAIKPETVVKRRMIEELTGKVSLGPHQVAGLLRLADVDIPEDVTLESTVDSEGYVVVTWHKRTEREA